MRKLMFGLFGFLALGFGALSAAPAEAQPYYGRGGYYGGGAPVVTVQYGPRREWRGDRGYRPYGGYRPYRGYRPYPRYGFAPAYVAPRCFVRPRTVWNGYRWVRRPVRICR